MTKPLPGSAESLAKQARKSKAQVKREHDQKLQDMMLRRAMKQAEIFKQAVADAREKAARQAAVFKAVGLQVGLPLKPKKTRKKRK